MEATSIEHKMVSISEFNFVFCFDLVEMAASGLARNLWCALCVVTSSDPLTENIHPPKARRDDEERGVREINYKYFLDRSMAHHIQ